MSRQKNPPTASDIAKSLGVGLTKWADGAPPKPGVWNASRVRSDNKFRRWDGRQWMTYARTPSLAAQIKFPASEEIQNEIEWRGLDSNPKVKA